jgi:RimJ/RimL family protein N-acetyltransferase
MSLDYVYGYDGIVSAFVARLIPHCHRGFGLNIKTIGIVDDGELIAGIVYHNWDPEAAVIEISGAALPGEPWLSRETLKRMFQYPFLECKCQMIVQRFPADDERQKYIMARYGYALIHVPRMFGRDRDGVLALLTDEDWANNKFNRRLGHHVWTEPVREAAE